jgi:hypothetical protein
VTKANLVYKWTSKSLAISYQAGLLFPYIVLKMRDEKKKGIGTCENSGTVPDMINKDSHRAHFSSYYYRKYIKKN